MSAVTATGCTAEPARSEVTPPPSSAGPANDANNQSEIAEQILPSVVSVEVRRGDRSATGSGFRVAVPGIIVTNAHIVQNADEVSVVLRDGTRRPARMLGSAPDYDIAALEVDDSGLPPLHSGSGLANARIGDPVLAIGFSTGASDAVTSGTVRALNQPVRLGSGSAELEAVQTDAAITPESSGGPLVNARGEVLGVLTAIATPADPTGATFAIPVDVARREALRIVGNA
ncbi:MAG: S1C family serine protease [Pseudonocardiaceae bacterium]